MIHRAMVIALCAAATALFAVEPGRAQGGDALDRTPQECVSLSRVRSTRVIDDRTILFFMRDRSEVYRNDLPRECPRLQREGRFAYESSFGRLCDIDVISVLETFGGRIDRGATCQLGKFHPITRAEAEDVLAGPEGASREDDIDVEEVELPEGEDGEEGEDDGTGADESDTSEE